LYAWEIYKIFVAKCEGAQATWETQSKWRKILKWTSQGAL